MDISLGTLYAEMAIDLSQLEKNRQDTISKIESLRDEVDKIVNSTGGEINAGMQARLVSLTNEIKTYEKVLASLDDENAKLQQSMKDAGDILTNYLTKPILNLAESSVASFAKFEQSMQNTFSVMGATESEMEMLKDVAKEMGETTRFSASQAADALYSLGSAGQSATQAASSLKGVLQLAGATGSDLAFTSSTISSTLSQFNLDAGKAGHIADVFAKAIGKSQANMSKLTYSMKYVGPVASGLGISLESTTSALMQLYNTGYGGEQAGTYLRQAFQKLASGTDDLKNKLAELGIAYSDINPQTQNFADIIDILHENNIGVTESIAIFGETSGGAMAKLIEGGGEALRTMEGMLEASDGAAEKMQDIQNSSFANTTAELASAMEAVQITIGEIITPFVDVIAKGLTQVLQTINQMPIGVKTFGVALLAIGASMGPLIALKATLPIIQAKMAALNATMAANPIFLAVAAIAAVGAAAYALYKQVSSYNQNIMDQVKKDIQEVKEAQKKAEEAGSKAKGIEELQRKYEQLRSKTELTKAEQTEYNNTLKRLTELVPSVVQGVDETGRAYIKNISSIRQAKLAHLKLEEEENLKARSKLTAAKATAEAMLNVQKTNVAKAEQELERVNRMQESFYSKLKQLTNIKDLLENGHFDSNQAANKLNEVIKKFGDEHNRLKDMIDFYLNGDHDTAGVGKKGAKFEEMWQFVSQYIITMNKDMEATETRYKHVINLKKEVDEATKELAELDKKDEALKTFKEAILPDKVQTQEEITKGIVGGVENAVKQAKGMKIAKGFFDKDFTNIDAWQARVEYYEKSLEKMVNMVEKVEVTEAFDSTMNEVNGKFQYTNQYLEQVRLKLAEARSKLENAKNAKPATAKASASPNEPVDNSLDARLKALDDKYQKQLELARQYGKDTFELEKKQAEERRSLILQEYARQLKELQNSYDKKIKATKDAKEKASLEEQKENAGDEALKKSTGGKGEREAITIQDELNKSDEMLREAFEKTTTEEERRLRELTEGHQRFNNIVEKMNELKKQIETLEENNDGSAMDEIKLAHLKEQLAEAEEEARSLSAQLDNGYKSIDEINANIDEFYKKDHTGFVARFKDISKAKTDALKVIDKQVANNTLSVEEADKVKQRLNAEALKASALVGLELSNSVLNVAQTLTNSIINAIESGESALKATMSVISGFMGQAQNMLTDPIQKGILGSVMIVFSLIDTIASYAERKRQKEEEERKKAIEERNKRELEHAKQIAGESAKEYAKHINDATDKSFRGDLLQKMLSEARDKKINAALQNMGESTTNFIKSNTGLFAGKVTDIVDAKKQFDTIIKDLLNTKDPVERNKKLDALYKKDYKLAQKLSYLMQEQKKLKEKGKPTLSQEEIIETAWWRHLKSEQNDGNIQFINLDELIEEYSKAVAEGDIKRAEKLKEAIHKHTEDSLRSQGIDPKEVNALHNYIKDWNQIVIDAIKNGDASTVGVAFKEMLRNAILEKLKGKIFDTHIKKLLDKYEETGDPEVLQEAIEATNNATHIYNEEAKKLTGVLGVANSEMDEHIKQWAGMKKSITEALSSSLGDAAFNADWKSFKNAFAQEMRKAIISATVANFGVKTKVDEIIKKIMQDGKITEDEMSSAMKEMQGVYDSLEGQLGAFNKAFQRLTNDGVDVKHETQGNIIQKLSGADRDFFAEQFKENFKTLAEGFKSAMIDLKEIHNAQITVLQATLNVEIVNIHATDNMSLKEFIGELIDQARQSA